MHLRCALIPSRFVLSAVAAVSAALAGSQLAPALGQGMASSSRVIHRFDFDERDEGNLEDLPKYWEPLRPPGFPQFATGAFSETVGHERPPSFHLDSAGRDVCFAYSGPDTRVRPDGDYHVQAYVRPDGLTAARACLTACFLDRQGRPLIDTVVRSRLVGGDEEGDDWSPVSLFLSDAPVEAHTIGLAAWVLQESTWSASVPPRRHFVRRDVHGGAWFDDITVFALARVQLRTPEVGGVLAPPGPQALHIELADVQGSQVTGRLRITSADHELVETHVLDGAVANTGESEAIEVGHLRPGLYRADLEVFEGNEEVASRSLDFVRLAPRQNVGRGRARSFGVVLDPAERLDRQSTLLLLRQALVGAVKVPLWTGRAEEPTGHDRPLILDRLVQELVKDGFDLTGVFAGPPCEIVQRDGPYPWSLIDLLAGSPDEWREPLSAVVAPYAGAFRWWQAGMDGDLAWTQDPDAGRALTQIREAMRRFIINPLLAVPASPGFAATPTDLPAEQLALILGPSTPSEGIAELIGSKKQRGFSSLTAYVEPLDPTAFARLPRLADWVQRILAARHGGAASVMVPQPWHQRDTAFGNVIEPDENFVVLRSLADLLGHAHPGPRVPLPGSATCLAFYDGERCVLALWDAHAPPEGTEYAIQLGAATATVNVWGEAVPLVRDDQGRSLVRLGALPVFVDDVERWLIDLRTSVTLTPTHVESGREQVRHTLVVANPTDRAVAGSLWLEPPEGWEVSPRNISLNLAGHRNAEFVVHARYPHNVPAGRHELLARMSLPSQGYVLEIPLPIEISLSDVEVWAQAMLDHGDLVLRQVVKNLSEGVLHFRGTATVPARVRQYRPVVNLQPGDTQVVEYRFDGGNDLAGQVVQVGLREMNDGPRTHTLELVVP